LVTAENDGRGVLALTFRPIRCSGQTTEEISRRRDFTRVA
jgi:hypothetical protein